MTAEGDPPEVVLRVAVRDPRKAAVERFTKEFAPLVTSGSPGMTGYTTGRPPVREVFAYWPALIAKIRRDAAVVEVGRDADRCHFRDIAHGRSGDKGNHANVAIIAYTDAGLRLAARAPHGRGRGGVLRAARAESRWSASRRRTSAG